MEKIRVGVIGYGNLGKGAIKNIKFFPDLELVALFSRRDPASLGCGNIPAYPVSNVSEFKDKIDVMLLCGGSANDLMEQTPLYTKDFNTIDTFDTHAKLPQHFAEVDNVAKQNKKVSIISVGWDPGLFSMNRVLADSILPNGAVYSFWGKGVSQGHSNAVKNIAGVKNAVQFTIPSEEAMEKALKGEKMPVKAEDLHSRLCYVVLKDGANQDEVRQKIVNMPNYFADYKTEVNFISEEEFNQKYAGKLPHGGHVISSGKGADNENMSVKFSLDLDSNPSFTACVVLAYVRGVMNFYKKQDFGAKTVLDVPLRYLSDKPYQDLLHNFM